MVHGQALCLAPCDGHGVKVIERGVEVFWFFFVSFIFVIAMIGG
jgi:hypothetical protein